MASIRAFSYPHAVASRGISTLNSVRSRNGGFEIKKFLSRPQWRAGSRGKLVVQANELNKWAGRAFDDQCEPNPFDEETAHVLLRVLTARAVKKMLTQLQELDMLVAQWFNNYAAEHPPTEGDKFIEELFNAKGATVLDPNTQTTHHVDPQNLAHRLLLIREDMAKRATLDLPQYMARRNTAVLRGHLERNTFISGGGSETGYKDRRGYFRPRGNGNGNGSK